MHLAFSAQTDDCCQDVKAEKESCLFLENKDALKTFMVLFYFSVCGASAAGLYHGKTGSSSHKAMVHFGAFPSVNE